MAELSTDSTPASGCCDPEPQAGCCEPPDKEECCGTAAAPGGSCGCSAGQQIRSWPDGRQPEASVGTAALRELAAGAAVAGR